MNNIINHTPEERLAELWDISWERSNFMSLINLLYKDDNLKWKLKYAPMHGSFLEAGCGMGQYVFYLNELGFKIQGIDISEYAINQCKKIGSIIGKCKNNFQKRQNCFK